MKDPNDDRSQDLLAGECVSSGGHTWDMPITATREAPYRLCVWCRRRLPLKLDELLKFVDPSPEFERHVREFLARGQAAQRAIDELGVGKPAKPKRGVSKNAAKSADKPERSR